MDLYAFLAELDGTGVLLAYLFIKKESPKGTATPPGTLTQVLDRFLRPLKQSGLSPTFVDCDKDRLEINAVEQVWPFAKVQLCFWHAKRAIQTKLKGSTKMNTLAQYPPCEAQSLVSGLEICWGSIPTKRTDRNHKYS
ncbi:hypothetical protein K3495_g12747 [Podosphaera aphanis]|nr:hypothetical protein K3495_g12747 [Podosphaera aphanis]